MLNLPILMLHAVGDFGGHSRAMSISEKKLIELLDTIEKTGRLTITFSDMLKHGGKVPKNALIITFDDCYAHLLDFAIPELRKRDMKAIFYAPVSHLGSYNSWDHYNGEAPKLDIMTAEQLLMLQEWGMEIGSHALHHVDLMQLQTMCQLENLSRSKMELEKLLGTEVLSFAWPYGKVPSAYKILMSKSGYEYGVCIYRAFENHYTLRRIGIHESDTPKSIIRKLGVPYLIFRKILDLALGLKSRIAFRKAPVSHSMKYPK